jgi:ribosomal protein S18 acetylase RimI-like enzyme
MPRRRLESDGRSPATMRIKRDDWLSCTVGRSVFAIEVGDSPPGEAARALAAHRQDQSEAFHYVKVPTQKTAHVRALGEAGMAVVDVNVTLTRQGVKRDTVPVHGVVVEDYRPADAAEVLDIAGSCFRYSRFHLDPQFPLEIAHRVKREWIANYVHGRRGERLLVARLEGSAVGFLAVLGGAEEGRTIKIIDLVGVATQTQGRGVGTALVRFFVEQYQDSCDRLLVGTQVANTPSLRLYERMGFRVSQSAYVLHGHVGPPLASDGRPPRNDRAQE